MSDKTDTPPAESRRFRKWILLSAAGLVALVAAAYYAEQAWQWKQLERFNGMYLSTDGRGYLVIDSSKKKIAHRGTLDNIGMHLLVVEDGKTIHATAKHDHLSLLIETPIDNNLIRSRWTLQKNENNLFDAVEYKVNYHERGMWKDYFDGHFWSNLFSSNSFGDAWDTLRDPLAEETYVYAEMSSNEIIENLFEKIENPEVIEYFDWRYNNIPTQETLPWINELAESEPDAIALKWHQIDLEARYGNPGLAEDLLNELVDKLAPLDRDESNLAHAMKRNIRFYDHLNHPGDLPHFGVSWASSINIKPHNPVASDSEHGKWDMPAIEDWFIKFAAHFDMPALAPAPLLPEKIDGEWLISFIDHIDFNKIVHLIQALSRRAALLAIEGDTIRARSILMGCIYWSGSMLHKNSFFPYHGNGYNSIRTYEPIIGWTIQNLEDPGEIKAWENDLTRASRIFHPRSQEEVMWLELSIPTIFFSKYGWNPRFSLKRQQDLEKIFYAKLETLRSAAAARYCLVTEGTWPDDRDMNRLLQGGLARDPFSSDTLKIQKDDHYWMVYSIGHDGLDNTSGDLDQIHFGTGTYDFGVRLARDSPSPLSKHGLQVENAAELLDWLNPAAQKRIIKQPSGLPAGVGQNPQPSLPFIDAFRMYYDARTRDLKLFTRNQSIPFGVIDGQQQVYSPQQMGLGGGMGELEGINWPEDSYVITPEDYTLRPMYDPTNGLDSPGDLWIDIPPKNHNNNYTQRLK